MAATLSLGIRFPSLHDDVCRITYQYLGNCKETAQDLLDMVDPMDDATEDTHPERSIRTGILSISLVGFLEAASLYAHFYTASERLQVVQRLRDLLTETFMVSIEGAFSSIRTSNSHSKSAKNWKIYSKRYANSGRPLGAMLLRQAFMQMLVSCSSMQVAPVEELQRKHILEYLMAKRQPQLNLKREEKNALNEALGELAMEELRLLDDGADYLQLGSAWQQKLAFTVKRHALTVYLTCIMLDEESADADALLSWLEDTIADVVEMTDDDLAYTVLMSLAILAKTSATVASALSRSLPRFIVQGGIKGSTVVTAARCLASTLQSISQDAVITGLYSLGNVLSAASGSDRPAANGETTLSNSSRISRYTKHSTGSAISIEVNGDDETSAVYGNVIRAIVSISDTCQDRKITALAQSMLVQKLGRNSVNVDLQIVVETAALATGGTETDLKSLLKLFDRFSHDAVVSKNAALMEAVRPPCTLDDLAI